jgi:transposase-like protein
VAIGLRTRIFELCDQRYKNITELARAMGISASQIYRVRQGKRGMNERFIVGAKKAFPESTLDELFYIEKKGG